MCLAVTDDELQVAPVASMTVVNMANVTTDTDDSLTILKINIFLDEGLAVSRPRVEVAEFKRHNHISLVIEHLQASDKLCTIVLIDISDHSDSILRQVVNM